MARSSYGTEVVMAPSSCGPKPVRPQVVMAVATRRRAVHRLENLLHLRHVEMVHLERLRDVLVEKAVMTPQVGMAPK